jgi:hypothetical protein
MMNLSGAPAHALAFSRDGIKLGAMAFAALLASSAANAVVVSLPSTGLSTTGNKLTSGAVDPHWVVVAGPGVTTQSNAIVVNNQSPQGLYFQNPRSAWIWTNAAAFATVDSPYTFELAVDLTGYVASTATITGAWGIDNRGGIFLNGAAAVGTGTLALPTNSLANFGRSYNFTIASGLVAGLNHLQVQVTDAGNPAAFNVHDLFFTATPVPEPSSAILMAVGMLAVVFQLRRSLPRSRATEA